MAVVVLYLAFLGSIFILVREKQWFAVTLLAIGGVAYSVAPADLKMSILAALAVVLFISLIYAVVIGARGYYAARRHMNAAQHDLRHAFGFPDAAVPPDKAR